MKRILIDGRFIGVGESMTRYCLEIMKGVLELDHENEYTLLIRPAGARTVKQAFNIEKLNIDNSLEIENCKIGNLHFKVLDIPHYSVVEQTKLLKYLNGEKYDLVHFIQFNHPVRYRGNYVITIHDLTLIGHLHRQKLHKRIAFGQVMKSAAKDSQRIITISETSKQEIVDYYHVPESKITVTYLGVDDKYNSKLKSQKQRIDNFKEKYAITGDYFLYTGMWKKHKNLLRMLKAYEILIDRGKHKEGHGLNTASSLSLRGPADSAGTKQSENNIPRLVLAGKIDRDEPEVINLIEKINHNQKHVIIPSEVEESRNHVSGEAKPIITTGFVEENELPLAYAGAMAYIIPSLSEGFGLPPLEAMACGAPVLSSNISAMPEILGDAPLYFDPYDIDDIAQKMQQAASDEQLRASLSAAGLKQAKKYDWHKTAEQTFEVYREILS